MNQMTVELWCGAVDEPDLVSGGKDELLRRLKDNAQYTSEAVTLAGRAFDADWKFDEVVIRKDDGYVDIAYLFTKQFDTVEQGEAELKELCRGEFQMVINYTWSENGEQKFAESVESLTT